VRRSYRDQYIGIRVSPAGASVCDPAEYFSHPSLVIYFFPTPPIKLKLGLQTGGETRNSNPSGSFKLSSQSTAGVQL
jgi:hypothetical protein